MKNTIISVKNLKKNYGSFEAVKGISFDVLEHELAERSNKRCINSCNSILKIRVINRK